MRSTDWRKYRMFVFQTAVQDNSLSIWEEMRMIWSARSITCFAIPCSNLQLKLEAGIPESFGLQEVGCALYRVQHVLESWPLLCGSSPQQKVVRHS